MSEIEPELLRTWSAKEDGDYGLKINVIGKSFSGKTQMSFYLAYELYMAGHYDILLVFTDTPSTIDVANKIIPYQFIRPAKISEISKFVDLFTKINKDRQKKGKSLIRVYFFLDDIGKDKDIINSDELIKVVTTGRHYGIGFIIMIWRIVDVKPTLQVGVDLIMTAYNPTQKERKVFQENYFPQIEGAKNFNTFMKQVCSDPPYTYMTSDLRKQIAELDQPYKIIKKLNAPDIIQDIYMVSGPFVLCRKKFLKLFKCLDTSVPKN